MTVSSPRSNEKLATLILGGGGGGRGLQSLCKVANITSGVKIIKKST